MDNNVMNAIAKKADAASDTLLNFVARAVSDPTIEVTKLEALLRMQREIVADDARLQFNRAMSNAQGEMQPVVRDAENTHTKSKYARLETIDAQMRPIYASNGFCLSFDSAAIEGPNLRIVCEVSHHAGHSKTYHLDAAPDVAGSHGTANKTPIQGLGSSVSYLRRYLTCMIFNVVMTSEDNDGNRRPPQASNDGRLTQAHVEELELLMRRTKTLEGKFLEHMLPGLRSITQAQAVDFPRLKNALLTKASVLAQRAARQTQGVAQ